jgi:hypothetical protein
MARRIRVGDVIEIITSRGFAYGHITHIHKTERASFGPLVRALPGFFDNRPSQFDGLVRESPVSMMFCALNRAMRDGICEVAGSVPVPEESQEFPLFRNTQDYGVRPSTDPKRWWFWDGEKSWFVGKLKPEQRRMPIEEIVDGELLRERVETGWSPATDPFLR